MLAAFEASIQGRRASLRSHLPLANIFRAFGARGSHFSSCSSNLNPPINYFNSEHTHAPIDLPTNLTIEQVVHLLKGSSSHWINQNHLVKGRFAWGRGYGAFSVSHSDVDKVANYIARQEEHHRRRNFAEEFEVFVEKYGLEWRDERKPPV